MPDAGDGGRSQPPGGWVRQTMGPTSDNCCAITWVLGGVPRTGTAPVAGSVHWIATERPQELAAELRACFSGKEGARDV